MNLINNYLIISAVGAYSPEIFQELTRACTQCGCNILNSKMNRLGQDISILLFVSGNWGAIAKTEATLPSLEQKLGLQIYIRRTQDQEQETKAMPYTIQVAAIDKMGILTGLCEFLCRSGIPIEEIAANSYASINGTRMANLTFRINIPENTHLATLREQFINYCDDNNLDAYLEPPRNY